MVYIEKEKEEEERGRRDRQTDREEKEEGKRGWITHYGVHFPTSSLPLVIVVLCFSFTTINFFEE